MDFKSAMLLLVVYTSLIAMILCSISSYQADKARKALYVIEKKIVMSPLKSWQVENRNINQSAGTFIVNKDEFGIPDNEPHLYLRSAYLDYRLNPPKAWVLAVAGKDLKSQNAQCLYHFKANGSKTEKTVATTRSMFREKKKSSCFFHLLIFQCDLSRDKPDYVTITFNNKGNIQIIYIPCASNFIYYLP